MAFGRKYCATPAVYYYMSSYTCFWYLLMGFMVLPWGTVTLVKPSRDLALETVWCCGGLDPGVCKWQLWIETSTKICRNMPSLPCATVACCMTRLDYIHENTLTTSKHSNHFASFQNPHNPCHTSSFPLTCVEDRSAVDTETSPGKSPSSSSVGSQGQSSMARRCRKTEKKCKPGVSKGCCLEVFKCFSGLPAKGWHLCNPWK